MREGLILVESFYGGYRARYLKPEVVDHGVQALKRVQPQRVIILVQLSQQRRGAGDSGHLPRRAEFS